MKQIFTGQENTFGVLLRAWKGEDGSLVMDPNDPTPVTDERVAALETPTGYQMVEVGDTLTRHANGTVTLQEKG